MMKIVKDARGKFRQSVVKQTPATLGQNMAHEKKSQPDVNRARYELDYCQTLNLQWFLRKP
jgi:hypothetical protein